MAYQARVDNNNSPLILSDESDVRNETLASIQGRTTDLLFGTVMAQNATTRRWVPFNSLVATNGESVPRGIYLGEDIDAADIAAEHIDDVPILVGNARVNENLVVWDDDTLNADSIVNPANIEARTARQALAEAANIRLEDTTDATAPEN
jgi:hypothetical protein